MPTEAQLREMLKKEPQDAFLRYALAMELARQHETAAALAEFEILLKHNPDYVAGYFMMGRTQAQSGDTASAAETYQKGIAAAKKTGDSHAAREISEALAELRGE